MCENHTYGQNEEASYRAGDPGRVFSGRAFRHLRHRIACCAFAAIQLDSPTAIDADGKITVVADSGSRRALIMNADGDLTGVVGCTTTDSPFDAITDVCFSEDLVFISGVRFEPDSDIISQERVAAYDKGGNYQGLLYDGAGPKTASPSMKSLNDAADGVVVAFETDRLKEPASTDAAEPAEKPASTPDAGTPDAGTLDAGTLDAGSPDEDASLEFDTYV